MLRISIFFSSLLFSLGSFAQADLDLIFEMQKFHEKSGSHFLKDFYCELLPESNQSISNNLSLHKKTQYVFYFKGSKQNQTEAIVRIKSPDSKQVYIQSKILNDTIREFKFLSAHNQTFILEVYKEMEGFYRALVYMSLEDK